MARKLKTFVTSVGFFDLAVAAPSMKAALEAWGFRHNAFQQGFANETRDADIIAAAMAKPGVVVRRPVGTSEPFREDAELPKGFAIPRIGKTQKRAATKPLPAPKASRQAEEAPSRAAIISFAREKKRRDRERAREEAGRKRADEKRRLAVEKAKRALDRARERHEQKLAKLERQRAGVDRLIEQENQTWDKLRGNLEASLDRARER
jgi:hypothetical protein